ncbi:class II fructose-bisphosphate aldolase [Candidatus Micrarchaeota archaeon]|nr:class II fructose-bisphosphate aldolase [Candidatus Micrarchaeota archaeon]
MIASLAPLLKKAEQKNYAVGAFNAFNLETIEAVVRGAESLHSPVILQLTEGDLEHCGFNETALLALYRAKSASVPVCVHFDHGKSPASVKRAVAAGFPSAMFDGSALEFKENVRLSKQTVSICRPKGVSVELEIGRLAGKEDYVSEVKSVFTLPEVAAEFERLTKPDALAVSAGTSHGWHSQKEVLDLALLKRIDAVTKAPLVLHGTSGLPDDMVRKAVNAGVRKLNVKTQLHDAFNAAVKKKLAQGETDTRKCLGAGRDAAQQVVEKRIRLCGSAGKA